MKNSFVLIFSLIIFYALVLNSFMVHAAPDSESIKKPFSIQESDTANIMKWNYLAYDYYFDYEYDSCYRYANKALKLSDKLLVSAKANHNMEFRKLCMEYKAISLANVARGIKRHHKQAAIDTLFKAIELIKQTGNKIEEGRMYESIGLIYEFTGKEAASLEVHLKALEAYREAQDQNHIALQLTNVSIAQRGLGNYGDALGYLVESLNISKENNDSTGMVEALLAMGFTYLFVDKWEEALKVQNDALVILEKMNDTLEIARVYYDMGTTNMHAENYVLALHQHEKALAIRLKSTDTYYISASYANVGEIYEILGNYAEAIKNYKAGLSIIKNTGIQISEIYSYHNLGSAYLKSGDSKEAMKQFQLALSLSQEVEDRTFETLALLSIADIYLEWNQPKNALVYLQKAEKAAPKSNITFLTRIYRNIAEAYFKIENYKNAYLNSLLYNQYKDSAVIAENRVKISKLTNRLDYENQKKLQDESHEKMMQVKQKEIARQKVVRNFSLFGALVILVLAIIYFIRFAEKKKLNTALNKTLSNLKATQSQLIQAEKMASLGELTAGIAHEIQNPLNFVNNFSEVSEELAIELKEELTKGDIEEALALSDDVIGNLNKINHHGKRASFIVNGMLEHSRTSTGEKTNTDINELSAEYLRLAYHGLRAKDKSFNASFKLDLDYKLSKIKVVPQDIGRVVLNLITNAFYAVHQKSKQNIEGYTPEVILSTKWSYNHVKIYVKDNGNGIPDSIKDKIFQPFFTTKPTGEGTGLGLSLSYDIITKGHGGNLIVETIENEGSRFIIQLPL